MTGPSPLVSNLPDPALATDGRTGVVTKVTAYGITVAVAAGTVNAAHLTSYAPAVGDTVALMKTQDSWLALGRVVGPGTATDARSPGAGMGASLLAGGYTSGTGTLATDSTGTNQLVAGYSLTFFQPANHPVLVLAQFSWISSAAGDWLIADLNETIGGGTIGEITVPQVSSSFGRVAQIYGLLVPSLGASKRTVTLTARRLTGTGTLTVSQSTARPGFMIALDLADGALMSALD